MLRLGSRFGFFCLLAAAAMGCGDADASTDATSGSGGAAAEGGGSPTSSATTTSGTGSGSGSGGSGASGGGEGAAGQGGMGTGAEGAGGAGGEGPCPLPPACDTPPPDPGPALEWNHIESSLIVALGGPNHRGRDLFLNPGDPQWAIGKFAYSLSDKDLKDEVVDVWLDRGCAGAWEKLGSATTTQEGEHETVEGVDDSGGRVYLEIPMNQALGIGRHRVHFVVRGDLTTTDAYIEVVPPGTPIFVTDVDGTLTTFETEEFTSLLTGSLPNMNADASAALSLLASKGYRPMYLTARPEPLVQRTRQFLDDNGFPAGIVHTTVGLTGATGASAVDYKTTELDAVAGKQLAVGWAFGNTASDADAYDAAVVQPLEHRVFFQFDDPHGGRRIEAYSELLGELAGLPAACEP